MSIPRWVAGGRASVGSSRDTMLISRGFGMVSPESPRPIANGCQQLGIFDKAAPAAVPAQPSISDSIAAPTTSAAVRLWVRGRMRFDRLRMTTFWFLPFCLGLVLMIVAVPAVRDRVAPLGFESR